MQLCTKSRKSDFKPLKFRKPNENCKLGNINHINEAATRGTNQNSSNFRFTKLNQSEAVLGGISCSLI